MLIDTKFTRWVQFVRQSISNNTIFHKMKHFELKVETVGKVYMVVGGAPEENKSHVRDVALGKNCAFSR